MTLVISLLLNSGSAANLCCPTKKKNKKVLWLLFQWYSSGSSISRWKNITQFSPQPQPVPLWLWLASILFQHQAHKNPLSLSGPDISVLRKDRSLQFGLVNLDLMIPTQSRLVIHCAPYTFCSSARQEPWNPWGGSHSGALNRRVWVYGAGVVGLRVVLKECWIKII